MARIDRLTLLFVLACTLGACAGVDRRFYDEQEPPRLRDGSIVMLTKDAADADPRHRRILQVKDGKVLCTLEMRGLGTWKGEASEKEWVEVLGGLVDGGIFDDRDLDVEEFRTGGGLFHLITVTSGNKVHRFSAQEYSYAMGLLSSREAVRRRALYERFVRVVRKRATEQVGEEAFTAPAGEGAR